MEITIYIYPLKVKKFNLFRKYCDKGFEISLYWFNIIVNWKSLEDQLAKLIPETNFYAELFARLNPKKTISKRKIVHKKKG